MIFDLFVSFDYQLFARRERDEGLYTGRNDHAVRSVGESLILCGPRAGMRGHFEDLVKDCGLTAPRAAWTPL
jgi:hypothetical protein